jgi:hypothetical protein
MPDGRVALGVPVEAEIRQKDVEYVEIHGGVFRARGDEP